jgi:hypothetical protein
MMSDGYSQLLAGKLGPSTAQKNQIGQIVPTGAPDLADLSLLNDSTRTSAALMPLHSCRIARRKAEATAERVYLEKREAVAAAIIAALPTSRIVDSSEAVENSSTPGAAADDGRGTSHGMAAKGPQIPEDDSNEDALPEWMKQSDGRFSPPPVLESNVPEGAVIVDEMDDRDMLSLLRKRVRHLKLL